MLGTSHVEEVERNRLYFFSQLIKGWNKNMKLAMIGLGKMGSNMAKRLLSGGHEVVAFDLNEESIRSMEAENAEGARTLEELATELAQPRVVWVMVPSGDPTEQTIDELSSHLSQGDIIVDGGNSNYRDTVRRGQKLSGMGIGFVDVGTSGGIWGLSEGYCMMVGGEPEAVERITPLL